MRRARSSGVSASNSAYDHGRARPLDRGWTPSRGRARRGCCGCPGPRCRSRNGGSRSARSCGSALRRAAGIARPVGRSVRNRALDEVQVGLLAGLHDAEFGVDRPGGGHEPVGPRLGAAFGGDDRRPGRPALALAGSAAWNTRADGAPKSAGGDESSNDERKVTVVLRDRGGHRMPGAMPRGGQPHREGCLRCARQRRRSSFLSFARCSGCR